MEKAGFEDGYAFLDALRRQNEDRKPDFGDFSEYLEAKARKQGVPIHGQLELTPLCNLNCRMCYVHVLKDQLKDRSLLTMDQWKALIDQAYQAGMFQTTLTGGECLTYPGFDQLYLHLQSLGCQVDVLTNGILLDERRIDFFRNHPPALLQVTLYGNSDDAYERVTGRRAFHTVVGNLRRVKDAGLPLAISITPNRALGEGVFETIRIAYDLTDNVFINTSLFAPEEESWRLKDGDEPDVGYYAEILRFRHQLKGYPISERALEELPEPGGSCDGSAERGLQCGGGRSGFLINWKGEMGICNRLSPKAFPLRDGFARAWQSIHEIAENWPRASECKGCAYEDVCVKCAAEALKYAPAGECPKGLCEKTRFMVSRGVVPLSCS